MLVTTSRNQKKKYCIKQKCLLHPYKWQKRTHKTCKFCCASTNQKKTLHKTLVRSALHANEAPMQLVSLKNRSFLAPYNSQELKHWLFQKELWISSNCRESTNVKNKKQKRNSQRKPGVGKTSRSWDNTFWLYTSRLQGSLILNSFGKEAKWKKLLNTGSRKKSEVGLFKRRK